MSWTFGRCPLSRLVECQSESNKGNHTEKSCDTKEPTDEGITTSICGLNGLLDG